MGRRQSSGEPLGQDGLDLFAGALRRQLEDKKRRVRAFDVGGTGVKTSLLWASALRELLHLDSAAAPGEVQLGELRWIERPAPLGVAPGEDGFASWLLQAVPSLEHEVGDAQVCFGVSIGGDVDHASGVLRDWWPGGGHPRSWDDSRQSPLVATLMGLPPGRTFVLHDGEAHLLGCCRGLVPPPNLACLAIGSGVGFGLTDSAGAVVDPSSGHGMRSLLLNGAPLSGAAYRGVWRQWLERPGGSNERVEEVMGKEFANMAKPWRTPWVSLVLGRRGMELAEAAHSCPEPGDVAGELDAAARRPAVRAFAEQWLHFLHTQLVPQLCGGTRRHPVERLCFAGGVAERNWQELREVLLEPGSDVLRGAEVLGNDGGGGGGAHVRSAAKRGRAPQLRGQKAPAEAGRRLTVLPAAPAGSALIGAALYALAGIGGGAPGIWAH